jgi:hypothetical protein
MSQKNFRQRFNKKQLLNLFLICAFPLHLWTILIVLHDVDWISRRTNLGDAIGVGAYAMVYALLESVAYFVFIIVIGLILPWRWKSDKVFAHLGYISIWIPLWPILEQLYWYKDHAEPDFLVAWLFSTGHPLWFIAAGAGLFIIIMNWSLVVPIYLIGYKERAEKRLIDFLGRISLLSTLYIFLDVVSIFIIIIRHTDR